MRIALTSNFSPWSAYSGGAQRSTDALAKALVARGHEVVVVYTACPWDRPAIPLHTPYRVEWAGFVGFRARRSSPMRPLNSVFVRAALQRLLSEGPLDAVHCQGEEGALVHTLRGREGFRFVFTPRYPMFPSSMGPEASGWTRLKDWALHTKFPMVGTMLERADRVVVTSQATAVELERAFGFSAARARVVPNGVSLRFLQVEWRGDCEHGAVLFFGRLEKDKGVDLLLKAMVATVGPERRIRIVGRGGMESKFREQCASLGISKRVSFEGWMSTESLVRAIAESALVVLPSRHESFGNAMVEAMAVGAPLVTTTAGSVPEVVGEAAHTVPVNDVAALSAAVNRLLMDGDLARELGKAGRIRVESLYSWDAVAAAYEDAYGGAA